MLTLEKEDELYSKWLHTATIDTRDIIREVYAAGKAEGEADMCEQQKPKYYAGVTIWRGDKSMTFVSTEVQTEQCLVNPLLSLTRQCLLEITGEYL